MHRCVFDFILMRAITSHELFNTFTKVRIPNIEFVRSRGRVAETSRVSYQYHGILNGRGHCSPTLMLVILDVIAFQANT